MLPFYAQPPFGVLGHMGETRAWVPMDDEHSLLFSMWPGPRPSLPVEGPRVRRASGGRLSPALLESSPDWYGRFRTADNEANDYGFDRERQRSVNFSGLGTVSTEDQAVTESMGAVSDRTEEHLAVSDAMVIRIRRRILAAARAHADSKQHPPGALEPEQYQIRSGGVYLPDDVDWLEATSEARRGGSPVTVDPVTGRLEGLRV